MPLLVSVLPSDLARSRGGGERYAFELHAAIARRLADWEAIGFVAASDRAGQLVPQGWRALGGARSAKLPSGDAIPTRVLLGALPASADLLICHQWRTRATAAVRVRRRVRPAGGLMGIDYGGGSVAGYRLARLPLPRADVGLHISEFEADVSPVKAAMHRVVRGGIDPAEFHPPRREHREHDVLLVGRFLAHKGQLALLEALPPAARALLIGPSDSDEPAYRDRVLALAAERGVAVWLDATNEQLLRAYQGARYTVQVPIETVRRRNATPPELLGLTMLEAMACGSVPIAPATGASAEFVRDGATGLTYVAGSLEDLRRVLERAITAEDQRPRLQSRALQEAARWTWASAAETVLAAAEGAAVGR